ncbi:ribonuclease H-like [Leptopilina heterotoma]|uniref:ribonuclease H-like n=1 Tax=Leptopilina heterotoma TaxID=63436 RepID=UPI001CA93B07|nr:ribonuclease H-like [Leptopilina heterotoma]
MTPEWSNVYFPNSDECINRLYSKEDSDPPVFLKDHSAFASVSISPTPKQSCATGSNPNVSETSALLFSLSNEPYTDVYVDGACGDNGGTRPRAGIRVWFGPDHPLNVSRRYGRRQTNNASEIEAATVAIRQARKAGIRKLRIKTNFKVLVQGIKVWVPKWQKNDWKTNDNKPVKNQKAYERLIKALKHADVVWEHVQRHDGIEGNENADRFARDGALLKPPSESSSSSESSAEEPEEEQAPENIVISVLPRPISSKECSDFINDEDQWKQNHPCIDLDKSVQKFEEFLAKRGVNPSDLTNQTLA